MKTNRVSTKMLLVLAVFACGGVLCYGQERSEKSRAILLAKELAKQDSIRFYGKIIDQDGNPVENATVTVHIGRPHIIPQGPLVEHSVSDAEGCFQVPSGEGKTIIGGGLYVEDIQKEGYEVRFDQGNEGHRGAEYQQNSAHRHNPDKAQPVIFHMRKKNPVSAFLFQDPYLELRIDTSESGGTLEYDLLQKKKTKSRVATEAKDGSQFSDFKMKATINTNDMSWTVTLAPIGTGCGILATNQFLYEAPQDGYQTEYRFSPQNHKTPETPCFYIRSRSQPIYTRLVIKDINANAEFFRISASVETNPYGERNLEPATGIPSGLTVQMRKEVRDSFRNDKRPTNPDLPKRIKEFNEKLAKEKAH